LSTAALCGAPLFSGFWSKDEIIDNANNNGYPVFFVVGLVGAAMTAAYMTRATYLTFFGEPRGAAAGHGHHDDHAEEHELAHVEHDEDAAGDHALVGAAASAQVAHGHDAGGGHGAHGGGDHDDHGHGHGDDHRHHDG